MKKPFIRFMALLLVPCLVGGPVVASIVGAGLVPTRISGSRPIWRQPLRFSPFTSQALAEREVFSTTLRGSASPVVFRTLTAAGRLSLPQRTAKTLDQL